MRAGNPSRLDGPWLSIYNLPMKKPKQFTPVRSLSGGQKYNGRAHIDAMYDANWNRYREKFLHINGLCYSCGTKSTVVDHLIPHKGDNFLFRKTDNHIPLCAKCHNTVTGLFDYKHRVGDSIDGKLRWIASMRNSRDLTFKVKVMPSYP